MVVAVAAPARPSLLREDDLPACFAVNARSPDGIIMGMRHKDLPLHGVQFHPESIATEHGHDLLANFLALTGMTPKGLAKAA